MKFNSLALACAFALTAGTAVAKTPVVNTTVTEAEVLAAASSPDDLKLAMRGIEQEASALEEPRPA